jgi:hypothetical protein
MKPHQQHVGVADGSGIPFLSILAMNIRTEISMGLFSDGCTSFAWKTNDASLLAQNWDVRFTTFDPGVNSHKTVGRSTATKHNQSQHQKNKSAFNQHDH